MFGTIATMRPKQGQEAAMMEVIDGWWRERSAAAEGAVCLHLFRGAVDGEAAMVVVFDTAEHYEANASDPGQDAWYRRLEATLEGAPRWSDGDVLVSHSSGLDTVGVVLGVSV